MDCQEKISFSCLIFQYICCSDHHLELRADGELGAGLAGAAPQAPGGKALLQAPQSTTGSRYYQSHHTWSKSIPAAQHGTLIP